MAAVRFTKEAVSDLNEIWDFVAQEDTIAASRLTDAIEQRCNKLAETPLIGRARPEFSAHIRSLVVDPFILFYQPVSNGIEILQIYHTSRDPDSAL
jgi:toxin ParE1/3/4